MKISVIVPFYNAKDTIQKCAEALLGQNYPDNDYEIIMVDNNSVDGSQDIVKMFPRIRLVYEMKQSPYAARNRGLKFAKGSIIAFTDSDCIPFNDWLKTIDIVISTFNIGIAIGSVATSTRSKILDMLMIYEMTKDKFVFNSHIKNLYYGHTNNMAIAKDVITQIGPFQERTRGADSIFVNHAVDRFGCNLVRYCKEIRVKHLEFNSIKSYYLKMFIYGRSRELYKNESYIRQLTIKEKIQIFKTVKRDQRYNFTESIYYLFILFIGLLFWNNGRLSSHLYKGSNQAGV